MTIIEKIKETCTPGSITTLFRLCSKNDIACYLPIQFPVVASSWSLILRTAPSSKANSKRSGRIPMCQLYFNSSDCYSSWRGAPVNVGLFFPSHLDGDLGNLNPSFSTSPATLVVLGCGLHPLTITYPIDAFRDALISLEVAFTSSPQTYNLFHVLASAPHTPASAIEPSVPQARTALRALERSLETGISFDTIFQTYSCRLSPGKVARPIPTYANTTVLQATTLLPNFAEDDLNSSPLFELLEGNPLLASAERYEYESDSDLDDEEGDDLAAVQLTEELVTGGEAARRKPDPHTPAHDTQPRVTAVDEGSLCHDRQLHTSAPDVQLHRDTTRSGSMSPLSSFKEERPSIQMSLLREAEAIPNQKMRPGSQVVLVKGVAWKTWHAYVYYCYSGIVNFSNLQSQPVTETTSKHPLHCSPKSMYQLAKKLRNDALSQLALKAIEARLRRPTYWMKPCPNLLPGMAMFGT